MKTGWKASAGGAVAALLVAGCASVSGGGAVSGSGTGAAKAGSPGKTAQPTVPAAAASAARPGKPVWFRSLAMTSATAGWALYSPDNPAAPRGNPGTLLARSTDSARTWADVTPPAARPMLASAGASDVLYPVDADRAYLAVTTPAEPGQPAATVSTSVVFATADGGRTWTESAPVNPGDGGVTMLSFADWAHGWLVVDLGAAMGQNPVRLYRTADGGRHWSVVAASPAMGSVTAGGSGIPVQCDKSGITFATVSTGWLTSACAAGMTDSLLVSRDGGATWAPQSLPVPAGFFGDGGGEVFGPQFAGSAGFVTLAPSAGGHPVLLASQDLGRSWHQLALPAGAGQYPQVRFFSPARGILVSMGAQGALGGVFYTTADGGRTWTPVPQGTRFTQSGANVEFASPQAGFAWSQGGDSQGAAPPAMYATADSGRRWTPFTPELGSYGN